MPPLLDGNIVTTFRFAPNAPEQNLIEDVWLKAKRFVREFAIAKRLFELATEHYEQITYLLVATR